MMIQSLRLIPYYIYYMNRIFLSFCVGLVLTVCSCHKEGNVFSLKGQINGLEDTTILLYGLFSVPDSIIEVPVEDGKFSCTLPMDTITPMYMLLSKENMEFPIFADKGVNMVVEGDTAQLHKLRITGGKAQEEYNAFKDSISHLDNYVDVRQQADSFIVKHPQSIVSIYLIQKYFVQVPYPNKDLIEVMIKQLSGNLHDNHYISRLQNQLNNLPKQDKRLEMVALPDTTGNVVKTNDYNDHFVVLSLWASWHPESIVMQDSLQSTVKKFTKRPVKFVNLSLDNNREAWLSAIREHGWDGIHLCNFKGWNNELVKKAGAQDIPAIYLINTSDKVIATDMWGKPLENLLDKQLTSWEEQQKKRQEAERKRKNRK